MNRKLVVQQHKDRKVTLALFSIGIGIALTGLAVEHFLTVLDFLFGYIGLAGVLVLVLGLLWLALVAMEYLAEKEDELE